MKLTDFSGPILVCLPRYKRRDQKSKGCHGIPSGLRSFQINTSITSQNTLRLQVRCKAQVNFDKQLKDCLILVKTLDSTGLDERSLSKSVISI